MQYLRVTASAFAFFNPPHRSPALRNHFTTGASTTIAHRLYCFIAVQPPAILAIPTTPANSHSPIIGLAMQFGTATAITISHKSPARRTTARVVRSAEKIERHSCSSYRKTQGNGYIAEARRSYYSYSHSSRHRSRSVPSVIFSLSFEYLQLSIKIQTATATAGTSSNLSCCKDHPTEEFGCLVGRATSYDALCDQWKAGRVYGNCFYI